MKKDINFSWHSYGLWAMGWTVEVRFTIRTRSLPHYKASRPAVVHPTYYPISLGVVYAVMKQQECEAISSIYYQRQELWNYASIPSYFFIA
jgi:hypothetical protein